MLCRKYLKKILDQYITFIKYDPMIVKSLDVNKNRFCHYKNDKELIDPEILYLSAIEALMYLATTYDII